MIALYPVVEPDQRPSVEASGQIDPAKIVMAFTFVAPASALGSDGRIVRFTTINSSDVEL